MAILRGSTLRLGRGLTMAAPMALVLALGPSACDEKASKTAATTEGDAGSTSAAVTPEQAAKVLARVGDKTITLGDYAAVLEHMDQFDRLRYQSAERRKELLNEMINVELLAQEAVAKGYDKDPVAQQEARAILRDAMLAEARKGAPSPADIPDQEVRAYYDAHKGEYRDPERRRLSIILLKDEATAKTALQAALKTSTAAQWGELVQKYSQDSLAHVNVPIDLAGDVGFVSPPGDEKGTNARVPEDLRAAAFEIPKVGDVLGRYVRVGDRFYLARLEQKSEAHDRNFAEAERVIRVKLAQDKVRAKEQDILLQLRKEFPVQLDEAALAEVKVQPLDGGPPRPAGDASTLKSAPSSPP